MPDLYDPVQVERLIHDIGELEGALVEHRKTVVEADRRSKKARYTALFGTLVGACGLLAALMATFLYARADNRADAAERDRQERTVSACVQFNAQRAEVRDALKKSLVAIVPPGQELTANQQAVADRYSAEVDEQLKYRDCSPAGLDAYFKNPPVNPAK